jgi:hypothetical protein
MFISLNPSPYQVGGCLPDNASTYVEREADRKLINAIQLGEFCYVLNSRQIGKSSLRARTIKTIKALGIEAASIALSLLGTKQVTAQQWYGAFIQNLVNYFGLDRQYDFEWLSWWNDYRDLAPLYCLDKFIETVLLAQIPGKIVIFIDEVDTILPLSFRNDFFVWRSSNPAQPVSDSLQVCENFAKQFQWFYDNLTSDEFLIGAGTINLIGAGTIKETPVLCVVEVVEENHYNCRRDLPNQGLILPLHQDEDPNLVFQKFKVAATSKEGNNPLVREPILLFDQ